MTRGTEEDDTCNRDGCEGTMALTQGRAARVKTVVLNAIRAAVTLKTTSRSPHWTN
jgi:hypothetical protein